MTTTINNQITAKRPADPTWVGGGNNKKRKVFKSGELASCGTVIKNLSTAIKEQTSKFAHHASERILILHEIFQLYHNTGVRSDKTLREGIQITVGPTYLQIDQGKSSNEAGCHPNPIA